MDVDVVMEHRFARTPDGRVWTSSAFAYEFWQRYRDVFETVHVIARVEEIAARPAHYVPADGHCVKFHPVPHYLGPWQYVKRLAQVRNTVRKASSPHHAVVLRVPSPLASQLHPVLVAQGRPYACEVLGEPWDIFAPGGVQHPLRPFFRHWYRNQMRRHCWDADACAYVTEQWLQSRYPVKPDATRQRMFGVSDVQITPALLDIPFRKYPTAGPMRMLLVGSLGQLYKSPDVILNAMARCRDQGLPLEFHILGDGKFRPQLEEQAKKLHLAEYVTFHGQRPAQYVAKQLAETDLFLLPSRTEGLPRALVEAMAAGLPCLGSTVGGIPELLPAEDLVPPGDDLALANKLLEVCRSPERLEAMAERNRARALDFQEHLLLERRRAFLKQLHDTTAEWLRRRHGAAPARLRRAA